MNKKIKAFTLVELVVSIVIISILSTIGFVSFSLYTKDARDSVRISDLKNIEKSMSLLMSKGGDLVKPDKVGEDEEIESKYGLTWEVGVFGNNNIEKTSLNDLPLDPTTKQPYKYLYNGDYNYYILETELENGEKVVLSNFKGINEKFTDANCFLYNEKDDGTLSITGLKNECDNIKDLKIPYEIAGKPVKEIHGDNFSSLRAGSGGIKILDSIYGPSIEYIRDHSFQGNSLKKIDFPKLKVIEEFAFGFNIIKEINIPNIEDIRPYAFEQSLRKFDELSFPKLKQLGSGNFRVSDIKTLNLRNVNVVDAGGFSISTIGTLNLDSVESLDLYDANYIGVLNIPNATYLKVNSPVGSVNMPKVQKIEGSFGIGSGNIILDTPELKYIGDDVFIYSGCQIKNVPKLEHIGSSAFSACIFKNVNISLPSLKYIGRDAFPFDFTGTITIPSSFDDSNYNWPEEATIIKQ